jgi:hypothetical protein
MAYNYAALVSAWNGATQPPTGVVGTGLTGSMTTLQKLAAINAWTVTGVAPTSFYITGIQIANCVNWAEFAALTAQPQSNLLALFAQTGGMLGGSAQTGQLAAGMILAYFSHTGPTVTALTALAQGIVQPWWQYAGFGGPMSLTDTTLVGVS